jgi:type III secretory pathway component EscS
MSAIVKSLSDLVASILGVITSLFTTAGQLVQKTIQFALASVNEILSLVANFLKGVFNLGGDLASFIAGKCRAGKHI